MSKEMGKKIKCLRECLGMSQEELAEKLGYKSRSTINKIETGINNLTKPKIEDYAKALGSTAGYLMGCEEDKKNCLSATIVANEQLDELTRKFAEEITNLPDVIIKDVMNYANFLISTKYHKLMEISGN